MGLKKHKIVEQKVEVDIDEYDNDDIISELEERADKHSIDFDDFLRLEKLIKEEFSDSDIPEKTLCDQMKRDWLLENWDDFTVEDLEKLLKQTI